MRITMRMQAFNQWRLSDVPTLALVCHDKRLTPFPVVLKMRVGPSVPATRCRNQTARLSLSCVPSMALNYRGESPCTRYWQSRRLAKGQGYDREVMAGGSSRLKGYKNQASMRGKLSVLPWEVSSKIYLESDLDIDRFIETLRE